MEQHTSPEILLEKIKMLMEQGQETDLIRKYLETNGIEPEKIETLIGQIKDQKYLKQRKKGFLLGFIGSLTLFIGFGLTVFFYHSGISIHYVMYSLTSIGAILLIVGLVYIIGW